MCERELDLRQGQTIEIFRIEINLARIRGRRRTPGRIRRLHRKTQDQCAEEGSIQDQAGPCCADTGPIVVTSALHE